MALLRSHRHRSLLLTAAACLLLLSGCATGGGGRSRGSVSAVAARAEADDNPARGSGRTRTKTDRERPTSEDHWPEEYVENEDDDGSFLADLLVGLFTGGDDDDDDDIAIRFSDSPDSAIPLDSSGYSEFGLAAEDAGDLPHRDAAADPTPANGPNNLIIGLSLANLAGDTIESLSTISLMYSTFVGPRVRGHAGLFYGEGAKGEQDVVQNGLTSVREFGADIGARRHLSDRDAAVETYLLIGLRIGALRWNYWQPVMFADGTSVASDGVLVLTPYVGLGGTFMRWEPLAIGAGISWGPRITLAETFENFDNDLFPSVGELRLTIEASVDF